MKLKYICFFALLCSASTAQNRKPDSLINVLKETAEDTSKVNILHKLVQEAYNTDENKAKEYLKEAFALAQKINYKTGLSENHALRAGILSGAGELQPALEEYKIARALADTNGARLLYAGILRDEGRVYMRLGDYENAMKDFRESWSFYSRYGAPDDIAQALSNIGLVCNRQSRFAEALDHFYKSLTLFEKEKNGRGMSSVNNNIGLVYFNQEQYDNAITYFKKSVSWYVQNGDTASLDYAGRIANIAEMYSQSLKYNEALPWSMKAFRIREKAGNEFFLASSYQQLGTINEGMKEYKVAEEYYLKCVSIHKETGNNYGLASVTGNLGSVYFQMGKYEESIEHSLQSLKMGEQMGDLYLKKNACSELYQAYEALK